MPLPIIAIVGRPNVGKSSLFNRIVGWRSAIVSDVAGTTRDRLMADTDWEGRRFILLDTGGLESDPEGAIRSKVQEQADMAMADADVIIMMADVAEGITPSDSIAANRLRTTHKPVVLAVNKVDNDNRELNTPEFYQLGMGDPIPVSAYHNYGIYDLMERVLSHLPPVATFDDGRDDERNEFDDEEELPSLEELEDEPLQAELNLAIVGRTNVGKSALLNARTGPRAIDRQRSGRHHARRTGHPVLVQGPRGGGDRHSRNATTGSGAAGHREIQRHPSGGGSGPLRHRADHN